MADDAGVQAWRFWCPTVVMRHESTGQEVTVNADEASRAEWVARGYRFDREGPGRPDPNAVDVPAELHIPEIHVEDEAEIEPEFAAEDEADDLT